MIVALGKAALPRRDSMKAGEVAALGREPLHPAYFFPSGLARRRRAKPEGKKEEIILRP